jgi:hypothetical protein
MHQQKARCAINVTFSSIRATAYAGHICPHIGGQSPLDGTNCFRVTPTHRATRRHGNTSAKAVPDMSGKVVLVTGSTDGIGKQTANNLLKANATVILHGRYATLSRNSQTPCIDVAVSQNANSNDNAFVGVSNKCWSFIARIQVNLSGIACIRLSQGPLPILCTTSLKAFSNHNNMPLVCPRRVGS